MSISGKIETTANVATIIVAVLLAGVVVYGAFRARPWDPAARLIRQMELNR
jgi:hypothetical protein